MFKSMYNVFDVMLHLLCYFLCILLVHFYSTFDHSENLVCFHNLFNVLWFVDANCNALL